MPASRGRSSDGTGSDRLRQAHFATFLLARFLHSPRLRIGVPRFAQRELSMNLAARSLLKSGAFLGLVSVGLYACGRRRL